ncbi:MAG TPA: sensor histidine kinase [Chryseosolibacter sp.]
MKFPISWLLVLALTLPGGLSAQVVTAGKADISDFSTGDDQIYLYGEWEFYWGELLNPAELSQRKPSLITVPGSWHRKTDFPVRGVATYRVKILLPEKHRGLAILCPVINSSARFFINGVFVEETGKVALNQDAYRPALQSTLLPLPENTREVELVVQVANFSYFSAGFPRTPQVDAATNILARINRNNGVENFFAGSLIAMCIYQLILFFLYQRGKAYLWLALICLGVALRAMIVHGGSFLLPNLYPSVDWEIWKKLEFGSVYGIAALFPLYVYDLFRGSAPRKPLYVFLGVAGFLLLAVLFTKQYIYGQLLDVAHIALLFGFVYAVYSIVRAWQAGNRDARIILLGVLASFPFILMEILQNTAIMPVNFGLSYLVELGVLVFLIFQVYLLANHYAVSYSNLEKIVEERTDQLSTANTVKDRLLSVVSHDIKSPLNSLRAILQMYNAGTISKDEFDHFSQHLEDDLNKTTILVENILYWTASQLKGIQLREESFDLYTVVEENVKLFKTIAVAKKISLIHTVPRNFVITSDKNIVNLVVRNLLSNALKFTFEGGTIHISATRTEKDILVHVKDSGTGMDQATVQNLSEAEATVSLAGTSNEKGTGLGISLCKEYLAKAGGELLIESQKGVGSTFSIRLPA